MTEAYPLHWPVGKPRTPGHQVQRAVFKCTQEQVLRQVLHEIQLLGGRLPVVSTNIPIRKDGLPYADYARRNILDFGVAVYFQLNGKQKCFACDKWDTVKDNMRAIQKTIEALRGIERWGSRDMVEAAFRGFEALPPPEKRVHWSMVLGVGTSRPLEEIEAAYRDLVRIHHENGSAPDAAKMAAINVAIAEARLEKRAAA